MVIDTLPRQPLPCSGKQFTWVGPVGMGWVGAAAEVRGAAGRVEAAQAGRAGAGWEAMAEVARVVGAGRGRRRWEGRLGWRGLRRGWRGRLGGQG